MNENCRRRKNHIKIVYTHKLDCTYNSEIHPGFVRHIAGSIIFEIDFCSQKKPGEGLHDNLFDYSSTWVERHNGCCTSTWVLVVFPSIFASLLDVVQGIFLHLSVWFHNEPTPMLMILLAGLRERENHLFFLGQTMQSSNKQPPFPTHTTPSTTKEGRTQRDFILHFFFSAFLSLVKVYGGKKKAGNENVSS